MTKTIALFASSRRNGNTGRLMDQVAAELKIEVIDLTKLNITAFDYEHRNRNDEFERLMERILGFDKIIFASPIYWYAVHPAMKIFLDRISDYLDLPDLLERGRQLRGKTGFVLCTSVDDDPSPVFIGASRETFNYLGMNFGGYLNANCKNGFRPEAYISDVRQFVSDVLHTNRKNENAEKPDDQ